MSQKKRKVTSVLEKNKNNKVNFHPSKENGSGQNPNSKVAMQNFADSDINSSELGKVDKPLTKLALGMVKQSAVPIASSDYGSVSTVPRARTVLQKDDSRSDLNYGNNPVYAWRSKNSHHMSLVRKKLKELQEREENEKNHSQILGIHHEKILGIADIASKNSARDFLDRANEKSKKQMNQYRAVSQQAHNEVDLKRDLEENKRTFNQEIARRKKELAQHDRVREANFFEAYQQKEIADKLAREQSFDRLETAAVGADSVSSNAYRSNTGSRLGVRRR